MFDLLALPFLLAGVIVYVLLARERAPRLAWIGGILLFFVVDAPLSQPLVGHLIALVAAVWLASTILLARPEPA